MNYWRHISIFVFCLSFATATFSEEEKKQENRVNLENIFSKLKIKGRLATGYLKSGSTGPFAAGSVEVPDLKLQLNFEPVEKALLTIRFNLNNASANSPLTDYVFAQWKDVIPSLKDTPWSITGKMGRFKPIFGEETANNNPIEGILPTNSAADVGITDEGVEICGTFFCFSALNGTQGVVTDSGVAKAWLGKLFYSPISPLYVSASYYDSSNLKVSPSDMSIAGLRTVPTGARHWSRRLWEGDIRLDVGKGKAPLYPMSRSDSLAIFRVSYGEFRDENDSNRDRKGSFGFVDGMWNCFKDVYVAARASFVRLKQGSTDTLNNLVVNRYRRYSVGGGYHVSKNLDVKVGCDFNITHKGIGDPSDNLLSALATFSF